MSAEIIREQLEQYKTNLGAVQKNRLVAEENIKNLQAQAGGLQAQENGLMGAITALEQVIQTIDGDGKVVDMPVTPEPEKVDKINAEAIKDG